MHKPARFADEERRHDDVREDSPEPDVETVELATFVIDGECPKCGKVVTRGHKKHLATCAGKPANDPTIAELIQLEVRKIENQESKLAELEVGGLIDLDEDKVVFMVVGSTGAARAMSHSSAALLSLPD